MITQKFVLKDELGIRHELTKQQLIDLHRQVSELLITATFVPEGFLQSVTVSGNSRQLSLDEEEIALQNELRKRWRT